MDGGNHTIQLGLKECNNSRAFQHFPFAKSGEIFTYDGDNIIHCIGIKDHVLINIPCSIEDKSQQWTYNYEVFQARCKFFVNSTF